MAGAFWYAVIQYECHYMNNMRCSDWYCYAVVGYTDLSSQLSSTAVSDMLERLFGQFDHIARDHKVYKVVRGHTIRIWFIPGLYRVHI